VQTRGVGIVTFVVGMYLACTPNVDSEDSTGYAYLVGELVPGWYRIHHYFWQSTGAILIVWAAFHSKDIKPIFINSFAQYLGKISYARYIVHGNILRSILYAIMPTL
jgi:peptidoglycan/LPS O-acetylase OafA/YrhL